MWARFILAAFVVLLTAAAPWSYAASVDITPLSATSDLRVGDIVTLQISIDFSDQPVLGGGFDLLFDESQLELVSFTEDILLGEPAFWRPPDYVPGSGLLERWAVGSFDAVTVGIVGFVEFRVRPGASATTVDLGPTQGIGGEWLDAADLGGTVVYPDYGSVTLTAVPLPASLWLLGAGLAVLGRFHRSHRAAGSA